MDWFERFAQVREDLPDRSGLGHKWLGLVLVALSVAVCCGSPQVEKDAEGEGAPKPEVEVKGAALYVAPGGNDEHPGTVGQPLATIHAARDRIRQMKKEGGLPEGGVTVFLRGGEVELGPDFHGEFVPWMGKAMWFPMPEDAFAHIKEQWLGWKRTGISMAYRPNYFHGGYVLPFLSTRQAGEFLRFAREQGSMGWSGDSSYDHWSTKGPMLYMHMRMLNDPQITVDQAHAEWEYAAQGGAEAELATRYAGNDVVSEVAWSGNTDDLQPVGRKKPNALGLYDMSGLVGEWVNEGHLLGGSYYYPAERAVVYPAAVRTNWGGELHESCGNQSWQSGLRVVRTAIGDGGTPDKRFPEMAPVAAGSAIGQTEPFIDLAHTENSLENRWLKGLANVEQDFEAVREAPPPSSPWSPWRFRTDPDNVGVEENWFAVEADAAAWREIPVPANWSATWNGGYLGYGWYRTNFRLSRAHPGARTRWASPPAPPSAGCGQAASRRRRVPEPDH